MRNVFVVTALAFALSSPLYARAPGTLVDTYRMFSTYYKIYDTGKRNVGQDIAVITREAGTSKRSVHILLEYQSSRKESRSLTLQVMEGSRRILQAFPVKVGQTSVKVFENIEFYLTITVAGPPMVIRLMKFAHT
jgi:hypothetical protein